MALAYTSTIPTPDRYSFDIEIPEEKRFYFVIDDNTGNLNKLGDGTFGIVFEARDGLNNEYAVKLLYSDYSAPDGDQSASRSAERFEAEMKAASTIRGKLSDRNRFKGVVETAGGTTQFHSSPAFQELKGYLTSLSISNYALVMPKYEKNLKQMLEENQDGMYTLPAADNQVKTYFLEKVPIGTKENLENQIDEVIDTNSNNRFFDNDSERNEYLKQLKQAIKEKIYPVTGYEVLKNMDFGQRISNIYPYIYDVAQGLKTLHTVGFLHLDLKPANIFIKKDGDDIKTAIGDLGFLDETQRSSLDAPRMPYYEKEGRPSLPLGTRHYRSPEQKDFFDVADVEVVVSNNDEINIIVRDPKFIDTIIEPGDVVLFSKYNREYQIADVRHERLGENRLCRIRIQHIDIPPQTPIQPDKRTQVYFYKRQRHRTDLFGFGALVFELLTCGKSPERFYDTVRGYDNSDHNVTSIMDLYRRIFNLQSTEPGLAQIFEPFKLYEDSSTYAPTEAVELILRCMLYKAGGTFYNDDEEKKNPGSTMEQVINYIQHDLYGNKNNEFERLEFIANNALYRPNQDNNYQVQNSINFSDELSSLQTLQQDDFPKRLREGLQYLSKLIRLVERVTYGGEAYFFELRPQNINHNLSSDLSIKYPVYKDEEGYVEDLVKDSVYTKMPQDITQPFLPYFLSFIRRPILLENIKYNINKNPRTLDFKTYHFLDSSPYGDSFKAGDWILLDQDGRRYLWQISGLKDADHQQWVLSVPSQKESEKEQYEEAFKDMQRDGVRATFYKSLSPGIYCLNMIGLYIYHLFFVGLADNSYDKPMIENSLRSLGSEVFSKIRIKSLEESMDEKLNQKTGLFGRKILQGLNKSQEKEIQIKQIIMTLAWIYAKLIFVESQDSYFSERKDMNGRLIALMTSVDNLKKQVAQLLDYGDEIVRLNQPSKHLQEELPQLSKDLGIDSDKICFSFNQLVSSLLRIPHDSGAAYLKDIFQA